MHGRRPVALLAVCTALVVLAAGCGGEEPSAEEESPAGAGAPEAASEEDTDGSGGGVVLEEDFEDDSNGWDPGGADIEEFEAEVGEGQMRFSVMEEFPSPFTVWPSSIESRADSLVDVRVEASVRFEAPGVAGVSCRISDPDGEYRAYDLYISSSGALGIEKTDPALPNGFAELAVVPPAAEIDALGPSEPIPDPAFDVDPERVYEIAAECVGGSDGSPAQLRLLLDGDEVVSAEDPDPIPSGVAGVNIFYTERLPFEPHDVVFDGFTLTDLGGA